MQSHQKMTVEAKSYCLQICDSLDNSFISVYEGDQLEHIVEQQTFKTAVQVHQILHCHQGGTRNRATLLANFAWILTKPANWAILVVLAFHKDVPVNY